MEIRARPIKVLFLCKFIKKRNEVYEENELRRTNY